MLKLADNPPMTPVADEGRSVFDDDTSNGSSWSAVYTKPRQEKALAGDLLALGVPYFLPLIQRITVSGGRRRVGLYPLFPSYLFVRLDEEHRLTALRTERIVQAITPDGPQAQRFVEELRSIETAILACPESIELYPRVVEGARVRITGGAMKGLEGVVKDADDHAKVWLQVTALGTGALVETPADLLENLD